VANGTISQLFGQQNEVSGRKGCKHFNVRDRISSLLLKLEFSCAE